MSVLYVASGLIFVRSLFRLIEYIEGNDGVLLSSEVYLYIFDALLMLGVESDDLNQRAWVVSAMKSMESIVSNAGITADVLEEVIRRQDAAGQRMDIRQVMHDTFTRAFAIV